MTCIARNWPALVLALQSAGLTSLSQLTRSPMRINGVWQAVIK